MKKLNKAQEWQKFGHVMHSRKGNPIAPSTYVLGLHKKNFLSAFGQKKGKKWLVLGATPETRDLGLKLGCEVTFVDMSLDMILKMNQAVEVKSRENEIMVRGNWLTAPLKNDYFNFVTSDVSLNNLPPDGVKKMIAHLAQILAKDGYISLKEAVLPDDGKCKSFEENLDLFRAGKMTHNDLYLRARFATWWKECYDPKKFHFDPALLFKNFAKLYKNGILTKKEFEDLNAHYNLVSHTLYREKEFVKLLSVYFQDIRVQSGTNERYDFYPLKIFFAKVKK